MKIKFVLFERTLEMIKELHLYIVFPYRSSFLRYCDLFDMLKTQCCISRNIVEVIKQSHTKLRM